MDDEILLRFLTIGVVDVQGDDSKLDKLRAAVTDLASALKEAPAKTASFTIVAADPTVDASDPTVQEAMSLLKKHWTTVANIFSSTPVTVIRAMLLDAVVQSARQDDATAVAFVNTARNILPHTECGDEQAIWESAVAEIENLVDRRAEAEWSTPETIKIDPLAYKAPAGITINAGEWAADRDTLLDALTSATGPHGAADPNPYWPHSHPQQWGAEFAKRLTSILADTVEMAVATPQPIDLSTPLATLAKAVSSHVETALFAFSGATAGLQRRTNLLWWKEALYSNSARVSYRDLPVFIAASLMALDLFEQVPTFSPASVSAFLSEAILQLPTVVSSGDETLLALVTRALDASEMEPLRNAAARLVPAAEGRRPLLSLLGHANGSASLDASTLHQVSGISPESVFSPPAWGALLYRELQAARATGESSAKRPRRKG
jgi:hypothetical protein